MIRGKVLATPPHDSVLERLPHPVTRRPRHADVVPLAVVNDEGKLRDLHELERRTLQLMLLLVNLYAPVCAISATVYGGNVFIYNKENTHNVGN
jgi:hypothetical protein